MAVKVFLILLSCTYAFGGAAKWDYDEYGPSTWGYNFPECKGENQSPIDISTADAVIDPKLSCVDRKIFWEPPTAMTITNNKHSLVFTILKPSYEINDRSLLPFIAVPAQYHFHWARSDEERGSEHTIDGKQCFGELHAVHYNKKYGSLSEAADKTDGLAVFGWLIDIGYPQNNLDFENFLQIATKAARYPGESTDIRTLFSLETFLPPGLDVYYRYTGSLTTPGCFESVTWTVFKEPIYIKKTQAARLASLFYADKEGTPLNNNFRPVQCLHGRTITKPSVSVKHVGTINMKKTLIE